jgi:hypothetical protein
MRAYLHRDGFLFQRAGQAAPQGGSRDRKVVFHALNSHTYNWRRKCFRWSVL